MIHVFWFVSFCCWFLLIPFTLRLLSFGIFHSLTCCNNGSISCSKFAELAFRSKCVVTGTFLQFLIGVCPFRTLQEPSPGINRFLLDLSIHTLCKMIIVHYATFLQTARYCWDYNKVPINLNMMLPGCMGNLITRTIWRSAFHRTECNRGSLKSYYGNSWSLLGW